MVLTPLKVNSSNGAGTINIFCMAFWDVDYNAKVWQSLPVWLRQTAVYAWLKVVVSPVVTISGAFNVNRLANEYEVAHNGQVCRLEGVLNDVFDATGRGIYIEDPAYVDALYIYRTDEEKPMWLGVTGETIPGMDNPRWAYTVAEEYTGGGLQFVVKVPVALVYDADRMKAVINKYRLVSKKNYSIVTY
jgi:hypothetical protein